jgi:hypothetical protein
VAARLAGLRRGRRRGWPGEWGKVTRAHRGSDGGWNSGRGAAGDGARRTPAMGAAGSRVPARGGLGEQCVTQGLQDVLEGELGGWDVAGSGGRRGSARRLARQPAAAGVGAPGCCGSAGGKTSSLGMPKRCRRKDRGALGGTVLAGRRNSPSGSTGNPWRRSVPRARGGCAATYLKVSEQRRFARLPGMGEVRRRRARRSQPMADDGRRRSARRGSWERGAWRK